MSNNQLIRVLMHMHPGFDAMDFFGPLEVLSLVREYNNLKRNNNDISVPFLEITTTATQALTTTDSGISIARHISTEDAYSKLDDFDILIVPGGRSQEILQNELEPMKLIKAFADLPPRQSNPRRVMSVCTGALFLAQAGILDKRAAVTNWQDIDRLYALTREQNVDIQIKKRFVVDMRGASTNYGVMTSAGPGAGLGLGIWLVEELAGHDVRVFVEELMQYEARLEEGLVLR